MTDPGDPAIAPRALRLADGDAAPTPADLDQAAALAWALKDLCYASWNSEPARAVRAADALGRLRDAAAARPAAAPAVLVALADWTAGIAALIRGDMTAAAAHLDTAAAAFDGLGDALHAAQAKVPKIMALSLLGRHDEAVRCALAAQRALLAHGDLRAASRVALNLGNLHLLAERFAEAAPHLREAAALFERIGDHEHLVMSDIALTDTHAALGRPDAAARGYAQARVRALAHGLPVLEAMATESAALLDLACGRYRDALAGLERARRSYADLGMPQRLAIAEKQLADAYLELHLLPEALAGYDAALPRLQALGLRDEQAWTLLQRGRALALAGRPGAAVTALEAAAALFSAQASASGGAAVALARAELALAGAHSAAALVHARAAAQAYRQAGRAERRLRADIVAAQALLAQGDAAAARALFDATLAEACALRLLPVQLRGLAGRAMAARAIGDADAGRDDLLAAVELFEDQRRALPGDEFRGAYQADHLLPFRELLRDALERHAAGTADATQVLGQLDRVRARTLADRLGDGSAAGDAAVDPVLRDLRARLGWLVRRLNRQHDEADAPGALTAQIRATEHELLERTRRARLTAPATQPGADDAGLDLPALSRRLAAGDALVEYGVIDDELFACVATPGGVQVRRRLARWHEVLQALRWGRFQLESPRPAGPRLARHMATLEQRMSRRLVELHAQLWQPIAALLRDCRRVLVVPHAQLGAVPFAALHDGRDAVLDHHELACAPSARIALRGLAAPPRAVRRVLALGESSRLPHAAREAQAVTGLLPHGTAFVGKSATLAQLRAHAADADVIHLACHAQFRADNPMFSALHLRDGPLTAEAIESMRLPAAVVVLSACETALHDPGGGDEVFGLPRAFLLAGAQRVLASLCAVDDATTARLMSDFYAGLRRDLAPAAALRQAQLAARRRASHPYHWASFVLVGGW